MTDIANKFLQAEQEATELAKDLKKLKAETVSLSEANKSLNVAGQAFAKSSDGLVKLEKRFNDYLDHLKEFDLGSLSKQNTDYAQKNEENFEKIKRQLYFVLGLNGLLVLAILILFLSK